MAHISTILLAFVSISAVFTKPLVETRDNLVSMPIAARIKAQSTGAKNFGESERARAKQLLGNGRERAAARAIGNDTTEWNGVNVPATDLVTSYTVSVGIGSGQYTLLVATGSANTWIGSGKPYRPGPHSKNTGRKVSVKYLTGSFSGTEYLDKVTLATGLVIPQQSIGIASKSTGFDEFDGILGIGPVDLTDGTISGGGTVPTVTDNLFSQGTIPKNQVAISFVPITSTKKEVNGELTFGGTDSSKFTGNITYTPIANTARANEFWGIDASVTYGPSNIHILSSTAGIVDTGTSLVLLATDAYRAYQRATGAYPDKATGLLKIDDPSKLKSLFFTIGHRKLELTANAQIWPRILNSKINGTKDGTYLIIGDTGYHPGFNIDFILGVAFHRRYYIVYDTANKQVGFATTSHTFATTN